MRNFGSVASGHPYVLPERWARVEDDVLDVALTQARLALAAELSHRPADGPSPLERYFDPEGDQAGMSFNNLDRAAGAVRKVTASDLLAVTLLNVRVEPRQARQLLGDHPKRAAVTAALAAVPHDVALGDFGSGTWDVAAVLDRMQVLHSELRATPDGHANRWVFAATLCARKLPHLMPVRDAVVCSYLAGGSPGRSGPGQFPVDIQVFAFVMSHPGVRRDLKRIHSRLRHRFGAVVEGVPALRLLDVALWLAGREAGLGLRARPVGSGVSSGV